MWIEHHVAQSADVNQINDYSNCLYSCKYCNNARKNKPIEHNGAKLLDPTVEAWADHFDCDDNDELHPVPNNPNANYTWDAYDLNDPIKCMMRSERKKEIQKLTNFINTGLRREARLLELAEFFSTKGYQDESIDLAQEARNLRADMITARLELKNHFAAIPIDAPKNCRCNIRTNHCLPVQLDSQMMDFPEQMLPIPS